MTQFYKEQNKELVVRSIEFKQNFSQGKMRMRR
jgi:hypothetical protein